jgi:hypothetical protein
MGLSLTMVEGIVGSCPYPPMGTQSHTYSGTGTVDGKRITLELSPSPNTQASASFDGQIVADRLVGTLIVHRLDNRQILAWTVQSSVNELRQYSGANRRERVERRVHGEVRSGSPQESRLRVVGAVTLVLL